MVEIWKDVVGYEGLYKVSNLGNVMNSKGKIMSPFNNKGYLRVPLYKDKKVRKHLIHVLVASSFLGGRPTEKHEVNHIDLNRKNNCIDNLEWVTGKENVNHAIRNTSGRSELIKKNMSKIGKEYGHIGIEKSKKPVEQIHKETLEVLATFESAREAAKVTNSKYKNISQVCLGEKRTHNGYIWRFVDKEGSTTIESTL